MPPRYLLARSSILSTALAGLFLSACSVVGARPWEQPNYEVLLRDEAIEIRRYDPYLIARTTVTGDYETNGREGFDRLGGYIFGNNRGSSKIAMTSPVLQSPSGGEKIAMTSPVLQERADGAWTMVFVLPSEYTLETVPEPIDERVIIEEIPAQVVAAIRYSGRTNPSKMSDYETQLREWLANSDYHAIGEAQSARYDPPWTVPSVRRNEVLIEVTLTNPAGE